MAQTVTVKASHDVGAGNDEVTLTHRTAGGEYASVAEDLPVIVTDDDGPVVQFGAVTYAAGEGGNCQRHGDAEH